MHMSNINFGTDWPIFKSFSKKSVFRSYEKFCQKGSNFGQKQLTRSLKCPTSRALRPYKSGPDASMQNAKKMQIWR